MTDTLKSRGPDDKGIWSDKKNNIFFGHRRLSIIDLSHLGKQPMISHNKRLTINAELAIIPKNLYLKIIYAITKRKPIASDLAPAFIESSPRSGPTVLSSIIFSGAGKAPDLRSKAKSVSD